MRATAATISLMSKKPNAQPSAELSEESVLEALRYHLQLSIEWMTDRGAYERSGRLLDTLGRALLKHRDARRHRHEVASSKELISALAEIEEAIESPQARAEKIRHWLARRGIHLDFDEVLLRMKRAKTSSTRGRSFAERASELLAELTGTSDSTLQGIGKAKGGRFGDRDYFERARRDVLPVNEEIKSFVTLFFPDQFDQKEAAAAYSQERLEVMALWPLQPTEKPKADHDHDEADGPSEKTG
jgi:Rad3-related DNA helicase